MPTVIKPAATANPHMANPPANRQPLIDLLLFTATGPQMRLCWNIELHHAADAPCEAHVSDRPFRDYFR